MGDPAGIGPEIVLKALSKTASPPDFEPLVFGDLGWMRRTAAQLGLMDPNSIVAVDLDSTIPEGAIGLIQSADADLTFVREGEISADAGRAAAQCVLGAAKAALAGQVDAIV